jgi:hypothetical protein
MWKIADPTLFTSSGTQYALQIQERQQDKVILDG